MKKLIILPVLLLAACSLKTSNSNDGIYTTHFKSDIAVVDDTIIVKDSMLLDHYGYRRIKDGQLRPKINRAERLYEQHPRFENNHLFLKGMTYEKH